jgi:hypothetical protein
LRKNVVSLVALRTGRWLSKIYGESWQISETLVIMGDPYLLPLVDLFPVWLLKLEAGLLIKKVQQEIYLRKFRVEQSLELPVE